jgi:heme/copper-type cytochrome/quinol oxidase subunit 3
MSNFCVVAVVVSGCVVLFGGLWLTFWKINRGRFYYFDAQDTFIHNEDQNSRHLPLSAKTGTFAENLKNYIDLTKLLITISAAAITFGGTTSTSKGIFAAKTVLAFSILFGISFCAFMLYRYDEYNQNVNSYTRGWYCTVESLGFSTLTSFFAGFLVWAICLMPVQQGLSTTIQVFSRVCLLTALSFPILSARSL